MHSCEDSKRSFVRRYQCLFRNSQDNSRSSERPLRYLLRLLRLRLNPEEQDRSQGPVLGRRMRCRSRACVEVCTGLVRAANAEVRADTAIGMLVSKDFTRSSFVRRHEEPAQRQCRDARASGLWRHRVALRN